MLAFSGRSGTPVLDWLIYWGMWVETKTEIGSGSESKLIGSQSQLGRKKSKQDEEDPEPKPLQKIRIKKNKNLNKR